MFVLLQKKRKGSATPGLSPVSLRRREGTPITILTRIHLSNARSVRYQYRDPITDFLQCLYVDFDFDGAQQKLRECAVVLKNDYFLDSLQEKFMDKARRFIFET